MRDRAETGWAQPCDLMGCVALGGTFPCELFLDLEASPTWKPPGSATSVLEPVELSSDPSEALVLSPTSRF